MTTPTELVSLAVRGTTQQSAQGDYQSVDNMLRLLGIRSFQSHGGFIPPRNTEAGYALHVSETVSSVQRQHLKHLQMILNGHPQMLEEWVQASCEIGKTVPDEYIPYLLDFGCQQKHLRKWLKLIMSDRARWLLEQHPIDNWNWYSACNVNSFEDVVKEQIKENRVLIYKINISLASEDLNNRNHRGLSLLRDFMSLWIAQTVSLLIKVMFIGNVTASYNDESTLVHVIRKAAYHLPLEFSEEFLAELRTGVSEWHILAEELESTFAMRREMLASIRESA